MESLDTARLTELAERKLHLLTQLRELSLDQHSLADQRRTDELLSVLSRKNDVIDRLRSIQDELKPFKAQEPEQRTWTSVTARNHCVELFRRSEVLIAEILVIDNQTLGEMTLQRDLVGQQLSQFASAEAIHEAYGVTDDRDEYGSEPILSLDG
jgi:hypothetical protein